MQTNLRSPKEAQVLGYACFLSLRCLSRKSTLQRIQQTRQQAVVMHLSMTPPTPVQVSLALPTLSPFLEDWGKGRQRQTTCRCRGVIDGDLTTISPRRHGILAKIIPRVLGQAIDIAYRLYDHVLKEWKVFSITVKQNGG